MKLTLAVEYPDDFSIPVHKLGSLIEWCYVQRGLEYVQELPQMAVTYHGKVVYIRAES